MSIRKKSFLSLGAVALVLASCGPAPEPATRPATVLMGAIDPPPIYALIGHRARLDLTSEQVATLDSIGQEVNQENSPLIRRLREMRGDFRGRPASDLRPGDPMPPSEEVRMLTEQLRQNNREAATAVREVLTPEQEQQTCTLFQETDRERRRYADQRRREAQQSGGGMRGGQRGMRGAEGVPMVAVWPWCSEAQGESATPAPPQ